MPQLLANILISFLLYALIVQSFKVIYGVVGFLHISHAISIALGGYLTYFIYSQFDFSFFLAIPFSIAIGIALMFLLYKIIYRPLLEKKVESWKMLIVSLGGYVVFQNIISILWGDGIISFRSWEVEEGIPILGAYVSLVQLMTIFSSICILLLSWLFFKRTDYGQKIKAISSNPELGEILGISKEKSTLTSFIIGTSLATCAGILIAADTDMTPTMGFNWLLYAVVAMIIGGMGKMRFLLLGSLLLATAQHLSAYYFDSKWMNATAYVILILFLAWKPYGFSGQKLKKVEV